MPLDHMQRVIDGGPAPSVPRRLAAAALLGTVISGEIAELHHMIVDRPEISASQAQAIVSIEDQAISHSQNGDLRNWVAGAWFLDSERTDAFEQLGFRDRSKHWNTGAFGEGAPLRGDSHTSFANGILGATWTLTAYTSTEATFAPKSDALGYFQEPLVVDLREDSVGYVSTKEAGQ